MRGRRGCGVLWPKNAINTDAVASGVDHTDGPIAVSIARRIFYERLDLRSGDVRRGHRRLCLHRSCDEHHEDTHNYFAHEMTPLFAVVVSKRSVCCRRIAHSWALQLGRHATCYNRADGEALMNSEES